MSNSESNSFQYLLVIWFALTSCLVIGGVTVGATSASGDLFLFADAPSGPASPPPGAALEAGNQSAAGQSAVDQAVVNQTAAQVPDGIGRSLVYGGLTWSILDSRLVSRARTVSGKPIVVVEAVVVNTTTDATLRVRDSDVAIVWPDGRRDEVTRFDQLPGVTSFSLDPGQSQDLTLVFKPAVNVDPELGSLSFEIAEPGRIPASLPLVGELANPLPFPAEAPISQPPAMIGGSPDGTGQLIVAPLRAILDINAGPYRAALGQRLVIIETSVHRAVATPDASYLDAGFWRLRDGGNNLIPARVIRLESPAANEDLVTLLFVVDHDPLEVVLTVAANTAERSEYRLRFPSL